MSPEVEAAVQTWLSQDKNEKNIKEIKDLVASGDEETLKALLLSRLEFGTAGLRARMGAGFSRMNDLTIIQTTQGLCRYLESIQDGDFQYALKNYGVVIGHDHRHNSETFALLAAAVFTHENIPVQFFNSINATPLVPFTVLAKKSVCGIMVTASHNPKDDNGYKVYWQNGAQITVPHNLHISDFILKNLDLWESNWWEVKDTLRSKLILVDEMSVEYLKMVTDTVPINSNDHKSASTKIVYTAMHGVGTEMVTRVFETLELPPFIPTKEQCFPDPDFSTVAFPNPEEGKSALKLACATAEANNANYIIANDPDADRSAVAQRLDNGTWRVFNGNETACLFAWWVYKTYKEAQEKNPTPNAKPVAMVASTVSSKFLAAMAKKEGFTFEETLTGFKWIANKALDLQTDGYNVLFGYEEAIGFMVGLQVPDKDGLKALGVMANMINFLQSQGSSLVEQLNELHRTYGYFVTSDSYFICREQATIKKLFHRLRTNGKDGGYMYQCGDYSIDNIRDCTTGFDSEHADKKSKLPVDDTVEMLTFKFANGAVITMRTSGTEPKIKYYSELSGKISNEDDKKKIAQNLEDLLKSLVSEFFQPEENNLIWRPADK